MELLALYQSLGFRLVYWERRGPDPKDWKGPSGIDAKGWNAPERAYPVEQFNPTYMNLGVFTGHEVSPGKFLGDVDFDWPEGLPLARKIIPATNFGFGRKGKKLSHAFFTTPDCLGITTYDDITDDGSEGNGLRFVELRGGHSSHQTMIAPSLHSPDVYIELVASDVLLHVDTHVLERAVLDYAIACLLLKRLPGGLHHDGRIALAGFLLRAGFSAERVILIGEAVCAEQIVRRVPDMSQRDVTDVTLVVNTTLERIAKKDKKIAGGPKLAEFIGERGKAVLQRLRSWIDKSRTDVIILTSAPMDSARTFVERLYTTTNVRTIHHQAGVFYRFDASAYSEHDEPSVRSEVWKFLDDAKVWIEPKEDSDDRTLASYNPNTSKVSNVLDALRGVSNLPSSQMPPRWLAHSPGIDPIDILACPNGLLHIPTRTMYPTSPHFFTLNGIDFPYEAHAPMPSGWLAFLASLWPDDPESIATVQEIFGYMLTPDTRFQKIFLEVGPPRSGKGVKGRILRRLVGERNTCSPTLAAFGRDFGKQVLVGKTLAIISDARIGGRTDTAAVAETLLSISGEDTQTVERKFLPDWNGKLSTRFLLLTNELPRITDVSGALAKRFIVLVLKESFYGKEDLGLFDKLVPELSGILNWALVGRDRLYDRGYFVQPESADDLIQEFHDLGSPEATFLKTMTRIEPGSSIPQKELFGAWRVWCEENGREHAGTAQSFARNVRAVLPWITMRRLGAAGDQERHWEGLRLHNPGELPELAPF